MCDGLVAWENFWFFLQIKSELFLGKTEHLVDNICDDEHRAKDLKKKLSPDSWCDEYCYLWYLAYGGYAGK